MKTDLKNNVVLITRASGGIGRAIAISLKVLQWEELVSWRRLHLCFYSWHQIIPTILQVRYSWPIEAYPL
jgi:hypothetical protein